VASDVYNLSLIDGVLPHGPLPVRLLHDHPEPSEIEALVASGDCHVTLATALDEATQTLPEDAETLRPELEKVIRVLLHLQRHYKLSPKAADVRQ